MWFDWWSKGNIVTSHSWENVSNSSPYLFLSLSHIHTNFQQLVSCSNKLLFFPQLYNCFLKYIFFFWHFLVFLMVFILDMLFFNNIWILLLFYYSYMHYFQCLFSYFSCHIFFHYLQLISDLFLGSRLISSFK